MSPEQYIKVPGCRVCSMTESHLRKHMTHIDKRLMGKSVLWMVVDRKKERAKIKLCYKQCFPKGYPHRWGCRGCVHQEEKVLLRSIANNNHHLVDPDEPCGF